MFGTRKISLTGEPPFMCFNSGNKCECPQYNPYKLFSIFFFFFAFLIYWQVNTPMKEVKLFWGNHLPYVNICFKDLLVFEDNTSQEVQLFM